jgi:hypothetical protein
MDKVFTSLAVSVDGFITGRDPGPGHGLGDGGILFGWYGDGDTPSRLFPGFRLFEPSRDGRRFFQELPAHIGLSLVETVPAPGVTHLRYRIEK